jgi:XisI protein
MKTLEKYRQIVRDLLTVHATTNEPDIESQIICDTESDRYLLLDIGSSQKWSSAQQLYYN